VREQTPPLQEKEIKEEEKPNGSPENSNVSSPTGSNEGSSSDSNSADFKQLGFLASICSQKGKKIWSNCFNI
jgi:hypothetical protein